MIPACQKQYILILLLFKTHCSPKVHGSVLSSGFQSTAVYLRIFQPKIIYFFLVSESLHAENNKNVINSKRSEFGTISQSTTFSFVENFVKIICYMFDQSLLHLFDRKCRSAIAPFVFLTFNIVRI